MAGLYFEEFEVGKVYEHALRRTVTEMDNMLFSNMTLNPQPLHIDRHFCETETEWGQPLMNSLFTLGLLIGISVNDLTMGTTIANLGMTDVKFPHPMFQGDTLRAATEIVSKRESKSRPDAGIVDMMHRGYNQEGVLVAECLRQAFMRKRPAEGLRPCAHCCSFQETLRRKIAKALESGADVVIFDLEDSVAAAAKADGRDFVADTLKGLDAEARSGGPALYVRVNALDTGLTEDDLTAVMAGAPDGVMQPKTRSAADVKALAEALYHQETTHGIEHVSTGIVAVATETAGSLFTLGGYGEAGPRLQGMAWGAEDLSSDLGATTNKDEAGVYTDPYRLARTLCLAGAVTAGVAPIDTVYVNFPRRRRPAQGMRSRRARRLRGENGDPSRSGRHHQRGVHALRRRHRARGTDRLGLRGGRRRRRYRPRRRDARPPSPHPGGEAPDPRRKV